MGRIPRSFFSRYTPEVARDIIGSVLVRKSDGVTTSGTIVEVEAYRGADDPASHAYRGMTKRTAVMFGEAGHAYVYFTYGNHYCLNVTTEGEGEARGGPDQSHRAPVRGIEEMRKRRGVEEIRNLASGPGKLTKAMGIDGSLNGEDLVSSRRLYLLEGKAVGEIGISPRIGLSIARIPSGATS